MCDIKSKTTEYGEGSSPSAPPISATFEETVEQSLTPTAPMNMTLSRDSHLVRDLLRKADGDTVKVASWLETMGESVTPAELQRELEMCDMHAQGDDIDAVAAQLGAPETYFCPISFHLFRDPVLLQTGQTYERSVIQRWLFEGGSICPNTGIELPTPVVLTPNVALRHAIEEWAQKNAEWILGPNGRVLPLPLDVHHPHQSLMFEPGITERVDEIPIRIQEDIHRQRRGRAQYRRHPIEMTRSQYDRIRRCVFLLFMITVAYFVLFVITLYSGDWKFTKIDDNPLIGFEADTIRRTGGTDTYLISEKNEWWRIATSALMTSGIIHLQWVVCCLWTCGRFLATRMSFVSLGLIYVISSLCGVLLSANFSVVSEGTGGSAGAFGFIGAVVVETLVHRKHYRHHFASIFFLALIAAVGILMGTTPLVDNWTNLGGLVGGFSMAMALRLTHRALHGSAPYIEGLMVIFQVFWFLIVGCFVVGGCIGIFLNKDSREDCNWCRQLTCVDMNWWDCDVAILPPDGYQLECGYDIKGNLTATISCPSGRNETVQLSDISSNEYDANLHQQCQKMCSDTSAQNSKNRHAPVRNLVPDVSVHLPPADSSVPNSPPAAPVDDDETNIQQGNVIRDTLE